MTTLERRSGRFPGRRASPRSLHRFVNNRAIAGSSPRIYAAPASSIVYIRKGAMPARPPVPGVIECFMSASNADTKHTIVNRHFFSFTGTADVTDLKSFATAVKSAYDSLWYGSNAVSSSVTSVVCEAVDLTTTSGNSAETTSAGQTGTGTPGCPGMTCVQIAWRIARRYRGGKPKTFLGGISISNSPNDDTVPAAVISDATNLANRLSTTGAGTVLTTYGSLVVTGLVNVSYYAGFTNYTKTSGREASRPTLRTSPVVDPVVAFLVDNTWHTQRRRMLAS